MRLLRPILAICAVSFCLAVPAGAQIKRLTWRNAAGKEISAAFAGLQDGMVSLRLANGQLSRIALTDLSWESARQAITLKWTPGGLADLRLEMPDRAGASAAFLKLTKVPPAEAAPEGWMRYRCAHFEFDSQVALEPAQVQEMARVFEATRELVEALPWRIEALPEKGTRFRALIYRDLAAYHEGGGPLNSFGVFRGGTGEIALPLAGASSGADTLKHEITHQVMQRLLPVIPWWVAEGTAEYVAIMKYENGYFDCRTVSKKQVMPHLEARAPFCNDHAFIRALEYRAQTQAEMVLERMLESGMGTRPRQRERLAASIGKLRDEQSGLDARVARYVKMFSLPSGQSVDLPAVAPPAAPAPPGPPEVSPGVRRNAVEARVVPPPGGDDLREIYATSALMIYYLTMLAPDRGERFARYMWGVQQLRDEYDLSFRFYSRSTEEYGKRLTALEAEVTAQAAALEKRRLEYAAYLSAASAYANAQGRTEDLGEGRSRFTHTPAADAKPPAPPVPGKVAFPEIPAPPLPPLTSGEVKKRREQLLSTLMEGGQALDFVERVKDASVRLGLKLGEKRQ